MTKQETFSIVRDHLLRQGRKSIVEGYCKYRGTEGLKCAVGCLIPDNEYLEDFDVNGFLDVVYAKCATLREHNIYLLKKLQRIHDLHGPEAWEGCLRVLAAEEGLSW